MNGSNDRFTKEVQDGLRSAQIIASRKGQQQFDVEHLLLALLEQEDGLAQSLLTNAGVNLESVHRRLTQALDSLPRVSGPTGGDQVYATPRLQTLLSHAEREAKQFNEDYVSVEHVLLVAADEAPFKELTLTRDRLMRALQDARSRQQLATQNEPTQQENESILTRYQDGYRAAKLINGFGQACKVVGLSLGGLIFLACASASSISNIAVVMGLVLGSIVGFAGWAIGVMISAQGQIAKATLDTAVNSSPFLSNEERAKIMSLP